jgi:hypothetical protein
MAVGCQAEAVASHATAFERACRLLSRLAKHVETAPLLHPSIQVDTRGESGTDGVATAITGSQFYYNITGWQGG